MRAGSLSSGGLLNGAPSLAGMELLSFWLSSGLTGSQSPVPRSRGLLHLAADYLLVDLAGFES